MLALLITLLRMLHCHCSPSCLPAEGSEAGEGSPPPPVRLELRAVSEDAVVVALLPSRSPAAQDVDMEAEVEPDSSFEASSEESSSSDEEQEAAMAAGSDGEEEPLDIIKDYAEIKQLIADMDADVEGDSELAGAEGAGAGEACPAHRAEAQLFGKAPLPSLAALDIKEEDSVQAAGSVQSMLEGMIVIRVSPLLLVSLLGKRVGGG